MRTIVAYTGSDIDDFDAWADEIHEARIERLTLPPRIRLYDGDWHFAGEVFDWLDGAVSPKLNDTGTISLELAMDQCPRAPYTGSDIDDFDAWADSMDPWRTTWLAHWAMDEEGRGTSNIHVVVDKDGGRIGGFIDPEKGAQLSVDKDGAKVVLEFLDDIQELKHVNMAANPILPVGLIQQPKVQFLITQVDTGGLLTLGMNSLRNQGANFNYHFNLLDPSTWTGGLWSQAQIIPVPKLTSTAPITIITGTIKQSWWDVMAPAIEDAELQIAPRRFLDGDPEPFPGAGTAWRNGTLFVDIVDNSKWQTGTSLGGNLATGLARSIASVTSNYVEDSYDLITGEAVDYSGYRIPGLIGQQPEHPYVVYMNPETFQFNRSPGGPCRISAGGQSMPGVDELEEAIVGYAGDVLGDNIVINGYGVGSLGNVLWAFIGPILTDSILANMSVPLIGRAAKQGWGHRLETASTTVTQAYTPAAFMDIRQRRRETDPDIAFGFTVASGAPWIIGDRGQGNWWLGHRVGVSSYFMGARVFVTRCSDLTLPLSHGEVPVWQAKFGAPRTQRDPLAKAISLVSTAASALTEIGIV